MSVARQVYQVYQTNQIKTLSQEKLVLLMFDGAVKFAQLARQSLAREDHEQSNYYLKRTGDIIIELKVSLDLRYDVAKNLNALYNYMHRRVVDANVRKDEAACVEVLLLLGELRDAWRQAFSNCQNPQYREQMQ